MKIILKQAHKRILSLVLKIAIVVFTLGFIYYKLSSNTKLKDFKTLTDTLAPGEIKFFISLVFVLMLVNWLFESIKWRYLLRNIESISLWRSIESVFCGLSLAIFTPNRIGEYGGRVFFLSPKRRIIGIVAMSIGSIGQLVLTNVFGAIALCVFITQFIKIDLILLYSIYMLAFAFAAFFIVFFFNIKWLNSLLLSFKWTRKFKKFYSILGRYRTKELSRILLLCLARYVVFSSQYFILFMWLIPELQAQEVIMMVCILFFVQSTLPSLDLFDVGVRSVTAAYFFSFVTQQEVGVIAITAGIWLINIIIPAILGTYFIFKLNFFGTAKHI